MGFDDYQFDDVDELTDEQITTLTQRLAEQLEQLEAALESTDESAKTVQLDQAAFGRLSRIDAIQQQQMSKAYRQRTRVRLKQTRAALSSIERGDYGICNSCEMPISFERLSARPESPICMVCQSEREL